MRTDPKVRRENAGRDISVVAEIQILQKPLKINIVKPILIFMNPGNPAIVSAKFLLIHIKTVSKLGGHPTAGHPIVLFAKSDGR